MPAGLGRGVAGLGGRCYVSVRKKDPLPVVFEGIQNMWMTPERGQIVMDRPDSRQGRAPPGLQQRARDVAERVGKSLTRRCLDAFAFVDAQPHISHGLEPD